MDYLFDYVRKVGKHSFTEVPFNEVDGVIFSVMSLIDVPHTVPAISEGEISFEKAIEKQIELHGKKQYGYIISPALTRLMLDCYKAERFRHLVVCDGFSKIDDDEETQATFFSIILPDNTRIVVCSGTDDTVVGWKEDFNMMKQSRVPCMEYAATYVDTIAKFSKKIIIVGHSKGGLEALYACAYCEEETFKKIHKAYSYDGPGYQPEIIGDPRFINAMSKMRLYVPNGGLVGRLFYNPIEPKIIPCKYRGLQQHDPLSWAVDGKKFKKTNKFTKESNEMKLKIDENLRNLSIDEKETFVKDLFSILSSGGAKTLTEVASKPHRPLITYLQLPKESKQIIGSLFTSLSKDKVIAKELLMGLATIPSTK